MSTATGHARTPELLETEVETELRASVRDLLTDRCDPAGLIERAESDEPIDLGLWRALAKLGMTTLHVPEDLGGQGATLREVAAVLEEVGRSVAPVPYLGSAVLATTALLGCPPEAVTEALGELATGAATAALAVPLSACAGEPFPARVRVSGDRLHGTVSTVADAGVADVLVVPVTGTDGPELHLVRVAGDGVSVRPLVSLDLTRPVADVVLEGAESARIAAGPQAEGALEAALLTGAGLLASEQVGLAQWCVDATVAYLKERYQFGRPVGSFQALKHRLADLWQEVALARAAARNAADALAAGDPDAAVAVHVAQSYCADVAVHAAEECVQLHGGIGMTWEHPAHLYLKRAKADQIALGTPERHRALLAPLVGLPVES